MSIIGNVAALSHGEIENIEKLTLRWLVQATLDFGYESHEVFYYSPDNAKDVAEDITREILDRLQGYNLAKRIFGTVDYKKARYVILPDQIVRQALFVDSKAEQSNSTATLQITQTSMEIRQIRGGVPVSVAGRLPAVYVHGGEEYLTSTLFLHYFYEDVDSKHVLKDITICCVPNGMLQSRYNPDAERGFWVAGRNAPSRGEEFRVRVNFQKLKQMAPWRVQKIRFDVPSQSLCHAWDD